MRKRLKRTKGICVCTSPSCAVKRATFDWYEQDLWTYIARFLEGRSLMMLAATNKWFYGVIMHDSIWKVACLRDLQVPDPGHVSFSWIKLYASAMDGSHSFMFRQQDKHIDWMRIGAFSFDSDVAILSARLTGPLNAPKKENIDNVLAMLKSYGTCLLRKVKTGIWIADLQLVRCPVCNQDKCEGTMQMLDARHIELFLNQEYQDGSWDYEVIGTYEIKKKIRRAYGAIFDLKYLISKSTEGVFNFKSWIGQPDDIQPKAIIAMHAVAVNTNLQDNEADLCSIAQCGKNEIPIRFPFRLEAKQPQNCGYPGFNLGCQSEKAILKLPNSGTFLVRDINYLNQQIYLFDPENCLPKRLLSLNLSGSPFVAAFHQNYTFLNCPTQVTKSRFTTIDCLSNSTNSVLATSSMNLANSMATSCKIIATLPIPISWPASSVEEFTSDLHQDIQLTWFAPQCGDCESQGGVCAFKSNSSEEIDCFHLPKSGKKHDGLQVFRIICFSIAVPALSCAIGIGFFACCLNDQRFRRNPPQQNIDHSVITPQPSVVVTGLDETTIESYDKLVLGESRRVPGPNGNICPICLSEYSSKETIRCIPECQHCFHVECVDEWLRMNSSCPLCRNSPTKEDVDAHADAEDAYGDDDASHEYAHAHADDVAHAHDDDASQEYAHAHGDDASQEYAHAHVDDASQQYAHAHADDASQDVHAHADDALQEVDHADATLHTDIV
ncbi:hypothetical protein CCACVL1_21877 [Corchorus capsularis]|uniref:non-specific serine/threonine protein kinase n=1 Tax=Corchorus capsularis TaxID=210143 RepID=A0A1R3H1T4_COCAP|nr:hypothetical protein CCACVL1_21877 [Corchorus capsularis]